MTPRSQGDLSIDHLGVSGVEAALRLATAEGVGDVEFVVVPEAPSGALGAHLPVLEVRDGVARLLVEPCDPAADAERVRDWASALAATAQPTNSSTRIAVDLRRLTDAQLRAAVEGLLDGWDADGAPTAKVALLVADPVAAAPSVRRAQVSARAVALTRRLVDARGNQCPPPRFAEIAQSAAKTHGLGCRVIGQDRLRELNMGGILAIGAGSVEPSLLVEVWYTPGGHTTNEPAHGSVALVGKGVTFDSGGLSLKSPAAQVGMHTDKAGAATVLGAMTALADLQVGVPVHAVLPIVENLPGPGSVRPGDVVVTCNGLGVEVVDTDFEGRTIMADALAWAAEHNPRAILDIATLTYQAIVALGPSIGAVIARSSELGGRVVAAADRAGEAMWRLPWAPRYAAQTRSTAPGAALKNHPGSDSGRALTAALFLGEFVPEALPWAHLDVAGPAVRGVGAATSATGFGVRTLLELLSGWDDRPGPTEQQP
jgi:leucyl aminopeptidase